MAHYHTIIRGSGASRGAMDYTYISIYKVNEEELLKRKILGGKPDKPWSYKIFKLIKRCKAKSLMCNASVEAIWELEKLTVIGDIVSGEIAHDVKKYWWIKDGAHRLFDKGVKFVSLEEHNA